VLKSRRVV